MDFFKKNKVAGTIIILLVVLNIVLITMFWLREFRHPAFALRDLPRKDRPERMIGFFQRELELTDDQAAKYDTLRQAFFSEMQPIVKEIHNLRIGLTDAIFAENQDEAQVRGLINQIAELEKKRELTMFSHVNQVRAICKPEQRIKLKDLMRDVMIQIRPEIRGGRPEHRKIRR